jgi:hypothetical protein
MNFISGIFSVHKQTDSIGNYSNPEIFSNMTSNFTKYANCLSNRTSSVASLVLNVASEGISWNNLTQRDINALGIFKKYSITIMKIFGSTMNYCFGLSYQNEVAVSEIVCKGPFENSTNSNLPKDFYCSESSMQISTKNCSDFLCTNLGKYASNYTLNIKNCLPTCFNPNNQTLWSFDWFNDPANANGNPSGYFDKMLTLGYTNLFVPFTELFKNSNRFFYSNKTLITITSIPTSPIKSSLAVNESQDEINWDWDLVVGCTLVGICVLGLIGLGAVTLYQHRRINNRRTNNNGNTQHALLRLQRTHPNGNVADALIGDKSNEDATIYA